MQILRLYKYLPSSLNNVPVHLEFLYIRIKFGKSMYFPDFLHSAN